MLERAAKVPHRKVALLLVLHTSDCAWKDIIHSLCRGSDTACHPSTKVISPDGPLAAQITNPQWTSLGFYNPKDKTPKSIYKEQNPTKQHLSRCQTENKLPTDTTTRHSVCDNFKRTRQLQNSLNPNWQRMEY